MKKAFTLIEILIVVVILGILAAIVIPQFTQSVYEKKSAKCEKNILVIGAAIAEHKKENKGNYPSRPRDFIKGFVCPLTGKGYEDTIQAGPLGGGDGAYLDFSKHNH